MNVLILGTILLFVLLAGLGALDSVATALLFVPPVLGMHFAFWMQRAARRSGISAGRHPAVFNQLVRLIGVWLFVGGVAFLAGALFFVLHPSDPRRFTATRLDPLVVDAIIGSLTTVAGVAILLMAWRESSRHTGKTPEQA
jgi:hypothetical protein